MLPSSIRHWFYVVASFALATHAAPGQSSFPIEWQVQPVSPRCTAISPNGNTVAIGGAGGLQLIDLVTRQTRSLPTISGVVTSAQFTPDGKSVAVTGYGGYDGGIVEIFDVANGKLKKTMVLNTVFPPVMAISPNGRSIAVGTSLYGLSSPSTVCLTTLDLATYQVQKSYQTGPVFVDSLTYSPDGSTLVLGCAINQAAQLQFWGRSTLKPKMEFTLPEFHTISAVAFSKDGKTFADAISTGNLISLELRDPSTGTVTAQLPTAATYSLNALAFSPDGKQLVSAGQSFDAPNNVLELWSVPKQSLVTTLPTLSKNGLFGAAWSNDGTKLVTAGNYTTPQAQRSVSPIEIWNPVTRKTMAVFNSQSFVASSAIAISPDKRWFAVGGIASDPMGNGVSQVRVYKALTGELQSTLVTGATYAVNSLAFTLDSKRLIVGGSAGSSITTQSGVLEFWDPISCTRLESLKTGLTEMVTALTLSQNGRYFATTGESIYPGVKAEVWNLSTLTVSQVLGSYVNMRGQAIAWTPDGTKLAVVGIVFGSNSTTGFTELWDVKTAVMTASCYGGYTTSVDSVSISPDGKMLIAGANEFLFGMGNLGYLEFCDLHSNSVVWESGTPGPIPSLVFNPIGNIIFQGSAIKSSVSGSLVLAAQNIQGVTGLALSPDGMLIAACSSGGGFLLAQNPIYDYDLLGPITFSPQTVKGGSFTTATIELNQPAPKTGVTISLHSSSSTVKIPATVTVPSGGTSVSFVIRTEAVWSSSGIGISASVPGSWSLGLLQITPR